MHTHTHTVRNVDMEELGTIPLGIKCNIGGHLIYRMEILSLLNKIHLLHYEPKSLQLNLYPSRVVN